MRGFTTGVIVVAGMLLSLQGAAAQANPLKELVSVRGTSTIQYERAVGKRASSRGWRPTARRPGWR